MKLWLLRPKADVLGREAHPWEPPFEKVFGLVVRADTDAAARVLAQSQAGNEGLGVYNKLGVEEDVVANDVWLERRWTVCEQLLVEGAAGVVLVGRREA